MGDNEPKSQSLSLQVQETAWWAKESSTSCKEWFQEPGKQQDRQVPSPAGRASGGWWLWWVMLVADQHGKERHSVVWRSRISAVVWSLPQLYHESHVLHFSGSFDKCLGSSGDKWEFPQEPIYGWSPSVDTAVLITCADILGVSPCQMGLLWLR